MMTRASEKRLTVEALASAKDDREKKKRAIALLRKDFDETFASAAGQNVLRWIMDQCGYQRPSVTVDPASTEINPLSTVYNESRRNLYLGIRALTNRDILAKVELKGMERDEEMVDLFS